MPRELAWASTLRVPTSAMRSKSSLATGGHGRRSSAPVLPCGRRGRRPCERAREVPRRASRARRSRRSFGNICGVTARHTFDDLSVAREVSRPEALGHRAARNNARCCHRRRRGDARRRLGSRRRAGPTARDLDDAGIRERIGAGATSASTSAARRHVTEPTSSSRGTSTRTRVRSKVACASPLETTSKHPAAGPGSSSGVTSPRIRTATREHPLWRRERARDAQESGERQRGAD